MTQQLKEDEEDFSVLLHTTGQPIFTQVNFNTGSRYFHHPTRFDGPLELFIPRGPIALSYFDTHKHIQMYEILSRPYSMYLSMAGKLISGHVLTSVL